MVIFACADIIELLLARGADIEAKTNLGQTAFHLVSILNETDSAKRLLQPKAKTEARTTSGGSTSLHLACEKANNDVVSLLLHHGAELKLRRIRVSPVFT